MTITREQRHYNESVEYIKAGLPRLIDFGHLIKVSFDGPGVDAEKPAYPVLYIDGRGSGAAKLLSEEEVKSVDPKDVAAHIQTETLVFRRVGGGLSNIRWAATNPSRLTTQGDHKLTLIFGDAVAGVKTTPPPALESLGKLPEPTEDLEQVKRDIRDFGYGFVKNALSPELLAAIQKRTRDQAAAEEEIGVSLRDGGPTRPNQRIFNLISKGKEYADLLELPIVDEVVSDFLVDPNYCLYSFSINIARPGSESSIFHNDQLFLDPPTNNFAAGINIMWFLEDVHEKNAGTRVFPASHKPGVMPADLYDTNGSTFASGPAGTAMFFESRIWHATGANTETSGERPVILSFFIRASLRSQENYYVQTDPTVEANLSPRVKTHLGWMAAQGVNQVVGGKESGGGITGQGDHAVRPKEIIGRMDPTGVKTVHKDVSQLNTYGKLRERPTA